MFNREEVYAAVKPELFSHLSKNAKCLYKFFIDGFPLGSSMLGSSVDPKPFTGKVIIVNEQAIIVEQKKNHFFILDKSIVSEVPSVGDKVEVIPYFRKQFNGEPVGELATEDTQYMDGLFLNRNSCILGDGTVRIPGDEVKNPTLRATIVYLQTLKLSDGYRTITDLLVDAGIKTFKVNDPIEPDDYSAPSIEFTVNTQKFKGDVKIEYDYGMDTYTITLAGHDKSPLENVYFDQLATVFEDYIDDGSWKKTQVNVLSKAKRKKVA